MAKKRSHPGPHKYQRVEWGKNKTIVWRCMLTNCSHYMHDDFIIGKQTLCHRCGDPTLMNKERQTRVRPVCESCKRVTGEMQEVNKMVDDILGGLK
jgi:ribosomal protein S27AE